MIAAVHWNIETRIAAATLGPLVMLDQFLHVDIA